MGTGLSTGVVIIACSGSGWARSPYFQPDTVLQRDIALVVLTSSWETVVLIGFSPDSTPPLTFRLFHLTAQLFFSKFSSGCKGFMSVILFLFGSSKLPLFYRSLLKMNFALVNLEISTVPSILSSPALSESTVN